MGSPEQARIADTLASKFRDLQKMLNEFTVEASLYQSSVQVKDDASRIVFQSITRALTLSEQMEIALNMMREDLRVIEATSLDSATVLWREYLQDAFDEHCCVASEAGTKVH